MSFCSVNLDSVIILARFAELRSFHSLRNCAEYVADCRYCSNKGRSRAKPGIQACHVACFSPPASGRSTSRRGLHKICYARRAVSFLNRHLPYVAYTYLMQSSPKSHRGSRSREVGLLLIFFLPENTGKTISKRLRGGIRFVPLSGTSVKKAALSFRRWREKSTPSAGSFQPIPDTLQQRIFIYF